MRVWAVYNSKERVGTTTTTMALGSLLANRGKKVLLMDLDPELYLTSCFKIDKTNNSLTICELFNKPELINRNTLNNIICSTKFPELFILPSSLTSETIAEKIHNRTGMGLIIKKIIYALKKDYDCVFIDCSKVSSLLMINALAACNHLLIPIQTEALVLKELEKIIHTLKLMSNSQPLNINYTIVPTMYNNSIASQSVLQAIEQRYGEKKCSIPIPMDDKLKEAEQLGVLSSAQCESKSKLAYKALLEDLLDRISKEESIAILRAKHITN